MPAEKKLIAIIGATATGKTKLAVTLARKFGGEIISADSRQVYRGMDIGTGKDLSEYQEGGRPVPYHLIDVVSPKTSFNLAKHKKAADRAIKNIQQAGRLPFLVGGTGLYAEAVIYGYQLPQSDLKKQASARTRLNKLTLLQLLVKLKKIDSATYKIIDRKNRRRVQRALEIYYETGQIKSAQQKAVKPGYEVLILGVNYPLQKIYQKIDRRLASRLEEGMIKEVKRLRRTGVSWKRLEEFGLEYRYVARYLRGQISQQQLIEELKNAIHHFAKRQLTWFRRNKDIVWISNKKEAEKAIKEFIKK
ncbi:MAG: tRNA (adenosine(37)-N6)-dimethylallyltransferase MiaA [Patescibacteria group bacterium]